MKDKIGFEINIGDNVVFGSKFYDIICFGKIKYIIEDSIDLDNSQKISKECFPQVHIIDNSNNISIRKPEDILNINYLKENYAEYFI